MSQESARHVPTLDTGEPATRPGATADPAAEGTGFAPGPKASGADAGRTGRFWSARRVPAALVALLGLAAAGLLLYELAATRVGGSAARWRREVADDLATRQLDDAWVIAGAVLAALLGLWLLLLALTPGLRHLLTMRGAPGLRAGLDRRAAALVLRDEATRVPGVRHARVKVRRRKAKVRATAHFRDVDDVRDDLVGVLADTVADLGLARQPKLSVRVDRPDKG
ncbi:DUF6286 domain-containing protein [Streptomyces sp. TRM 70351]|uniref:DUF6286 domain-containing protein n=1 Tax=Streptomyces sp. TRM 70351 TaxID=3116552 RepID=UPI002E7B05CC|nr:DUF6286 domain-containing protein [Streptomyces sp. TRM 70351]MEE1930623.1 DUF6286 domain-containing protein [Streptomyces sp. TRM 70351]